MLLRVILCIFLVIGFVPAFSQVKWSLEKDKNGIKVFTSKAETAKYKSVRVEAVMAGNLDKLVKLLLDAGSNKEWIYRTNNSYQIKKLGPTEVLSYTETSVPWPASNRDIPLHMSLTRDVKNNTLKVTAVGAPKAIPEKKGIVRIPYFNSWWDVKFDGKNTLRIVYFLEVDPGGSVPATITNMFAAKGPFETFNSLAEILKK
ncbi:MAG TPA: START domain-containing protein [Segetibacter sp.]